MNFMMKRTVLLTGMLLMICGWISAQCPGIVSPEPICTRVLPNGDVEIDFDIPSMGGTTPADIDAFILESSPNGNAPWTPITASTILVGASWPVPPMFTHVGANANTTDIFYRITAVCTGAPPTPLTPSSIIRPIRLQFNVTNDFEINLSWNWDSLSTGLNVTVNRKLPYTSPTWNAVASPAFTAGTMGVTDTVVSCVDTMAYSVILNNLSKVCQNISSEVIVDVMDRTPPDVPVIDTISFDPVLNKPLITWDVNPQTDTKGYVVLYYPNNDCGTGRLVDTIFGRNSTSVVDAAWYTGDASAQYAVYAFDNCVPAAFSISQKSVCVNSIQVSTTTDVCEKAIRLDWNSYSGFASGTDVLYKIFVSISGSNYVFVDSTTDNFFIHTDPIEDNILTYKVVAVENGGAGPKTTSSNAISVDAEFLRKPDYAYLRYATVAEENYIRLEMFTDTENDVAIYYLKRAADSNDVFTTVNVYHAPDIKVPSDSLVGFSDRSPVTDRYNYYYRVDMHDTCGAFLASSNFVTSMLLRVEVDNVRRVNRLEWTNVQGWAGDVFAYKIYRFLDGVQLKDPLTKFPDSAVTTVYYDSLLLINDNITLGNPSKGKYTYYIEAIENEPTFKGVSPALAVSNEVTVVQQPYVSSPNAFSPNGDGRNEGFKPSVIYHDIVNYEFYVMNRYGQIIYQTTNVKAYWDGTLNGQEAPVGVYVYEVRYQSSTGEQFEKKGTVTLVR